MHHSDAQRTSHPDVVTALKQYFGFDSFRPGQEAIVRDALAGRDMLSIMPTGGGKSLCFQLPAMLRTGVTLVVSPLIALMQDQVRLLQNNGIAATFLNSSIDAAEMAQRLNGMLRGEYRLVYLAPERLLQADFQQRIVPRLLESCGIAALVIDEAHCVSEWGHDFRPEYRQLATIRRRLPQVPVWAFTATATTRVREDIATQLELRNPAAHIASFNRPNLAYAVRSKDRNSYDEIVQLARETKGAGIIYCQSRKRVDELSARLQGDGLRALPYHAGLDNDARREHQDAFIRDDVQVIVATIAFGMGINKPDVRWVVHYDLPRSLESYYQESGRAGRDGDAAQCVLYFSPGDIRSAEFLIQQKVDPFSGEPLENEQRIARQQLRQVIDYAESTECRRLVQLRYFGEHFDPPCDGCDNCRNPRTFADWSIPAQQFLSCVARLAQRGERYGAGYVIDILRGSRAERVLERNHDELSVYGIGRQRTVEEWRVLARSLVHQGFVDESHDGYRVLLLNRRSWEVLRGEQQVRIALPQATSRREARPTATVLDARLFEKLRHKRKLLADQLGVPPYVIFHDASLREMANRQPTSLDEFAAISGVGQAKLMRYGAEFLTLIREHVES